MAQASSFEDGVQPLLALFDVSEQGFAWRAPRPDQIRERRAAMDDKLLFDNLLISGGVRDPDFIYPPDDVAGLTRLLSAIDASTFDALKKQTLVYFLLKWEHDGGLKADQFKLDCCIPPQFSALADAYWHLDTGLNIGKAISILSDSRVRREYASKIIQAITLSDQPGALLRKYVRTAKPALVHPPDLIRYTLALAESSLVEAWQFQRTFAETDEARPRLFKKILDWVIYPTPQPKALKELISLPLSPFEENILNEHAVKPPQEYSTAAIARMQDLVCVRYIELGKYADAIKMDRKFSSTAYDGKESLDRRSMIKELYDALPPVEKSLIDMPIQIEKPKAREPPSNGDVSMSQSWEEVRVPDSLNKSISTPLRNIQIPSAPVPRFTVATGNPTNPLSISAGPSTAAPILPISSVSAAASQSAFTPRKTAVGKAPAPTPPSTSLLGATKATLSGVGQRLAAGGAGVSSPASGTTLPTRAAPISRGAPVAELAKAAAAATIPPAPPAGVSGPSSTQPVFKNTANQANAFFQPKPKSTSAAAPPIPPSETTPSTQKRSFDKVDQSPERKKTGSPTRPLEAEDTMLIDDVPPVQEKRPRRAPVEDEEKPANDMPSISRGGLSEDEVHAMDESIFAPEQSRSRGPSSRISQARNVSGRRSKVPESISAQKPVETASARLRARKQPPGAFDAEAMDEDSAQEDSEAESVVQAPRAKRRGSAQPRSVSAKGKESARLSLPAKSTRGGTSTASRKSKGEEEQSAEPPKRRFPGGLSTRGANEDHDSEHDHQGTSGEEEDIVPPLPDPSPTKVTASKRPIRRTRSVASAAASDTGDDEGGASRRRSSRLTTAGSSNNLSPEKPEVITAPKSIKKSRSSTTKTSKRK
ncbi:nuclear pore complex assembly-domain-containing protein [Coprinopsis sp. MPI-PUGE-AT-0042]|nr:nuclear pore complex assembly-domain-containing protein [Coprinopsis sp. MPI-PUGE-AT-0042]